jgi:hypothetical protein
VENTNRSDTTTGIRLKKTMEELVIAGVFEKAKNIKGSQHTPERGQDERVLPVANKVLRIKRNHPVVSRVQTRQIN